MNIFHVGNKSPMQRGFFKNIASDLLGLLSDLLQVFLVGCIIFVIL